ncbi:MAG: YggT family protein [Alphaproteobacteria bacterium]|nr:YggT family protein [Alphaproteobacteria bacterium]
MFFAEMVAILFHMLFGLLRCIEWALMGYIILGWCVFFGAVKDREGVFFKVYVFLMSKLEPLLGFIRQFLPSLGGFDLSPLVVFLVIGAAEALLAGMFNALFFG